MYAVEGTHAGTLATAKTSLPLYRRFARRLVPLLERGIASQLDGRRRSGDGVRHGGGGTARRCLSPRRRAGPRRGWRGGFPGSSAISRAASASGASGARVDCRCAVGGPGVRLALGSRLVSGPAALRLRAGQLRSRSAAAHWSRARPGDRRVPRAHGQAAGARPPRLDLRARPWRPARRRRKPASAGSFSGYGGGCNDRGRSRGPSTTCRCRGTRAIRPCRTGTTRRRRSSGWLPSAAPSARTMPHWRVYVHIPFCESLCTFCGCNTVITRDHRHEDTYVDLVLARARRISRARAGPRRSASPPTASWGRDADVSLAARARPLDDGSVRAAWPGG